MTLTRPQLRQPLQPPRAPPDHLRLQSFQILSRLELIQPFRPWLDHIRHHYRVSGYHKNHYHYQYTPIELLWGCFSLGAPQCILLNLLGSPSPRHLLPETPHERFDFSELDIKERDVYFTSFIQRVQMLEVQGRVPYGEVLRSEDFLSGSNAAFAKVLRTMYRLLFALEESYPGLFVLPSGSRERRKDLIQELIDTERDHLASLEVVFEAAASLSQPEANHLNKAPASAEPCLESLLINRTQLLGYHRQLLISMEECFSNSVEMPWTRVFAFDNDAVRMSVFGAYRSICINYLSLVEFLEAVNVNHKPEFENSIQILLEHLSTILSRISNYSMILQEILKTTQPSNNDSAYNSLCEAVFRIQDVSETMNEAGRQLRTMSSARTLADRTYTWTLPDVDDLGVLLLDDRVQVFVPVDVDSKRKDVTTVVYSVVLFERMMLCCQEGFERRRQAKHPPPSYPIYAWEMGPALRDSSPLDIVHAIPVRELVSVSCPDTSSIQITWEDKHKLHNITFMGMGYNQWDQWLTALEPFVPPFSRLSLVIPQVTFGNEELSSPLLSEDEDESGQMQMHAKSWSVIARKGPRSETSSLVNQKNEDELLISPGLLPTLFNTQFEVLRSPSPLSLAHIEHSVDMQSEGKTGPYMDPSGLTDLTGKITKEGRYASAHGGFSDVWKGTWQDGDCKPKVAVKVIRTMIDDPEVEDKMAKRLHRELEIWRTLNHPHILTLYGVTSDFGHYTSMVCPWMENGSLTKYIERCGDILSIPERLKILSEVVDGLSYLHSCSVVHGDLTGSNILLDDKGHACLCDFGLSSLVAGFQPSAGITSTIGGAVRWADPLLYRAQSEEGLVVVPGTENDIYSFGSVMLEVLSGRIPYHYIRTDVQVVIELHKGNKPRRPAQSFVSDQQWHLMEQCWDNDPCKRPQVGMVCTTMRALYAASVTKGS